MIKLQWKKEMTLLYLEICSSFNCLPLKKYQVREIFSTHKQVGEKLDSPHFSGAVNEDYVKFNDKIVNILRSNGVGKSWG